MRAVGEQVILGGAGDGLCQSLTELALQEADDFTDPLQWEAATAQLANDGDLGQIVHGINTAVAPSLRDDNATLVPPLQLARRNAGEGDDIARCEDRFRCHLFQTINSLNV